MFHLEVFNTLIQSINQSNVPTFLPEDDDGFIEYKLRLDNIDGDKVKRMISQLKFRLGESYLLTNKYCAYYLLGVDDYGKVGKIGLNAMNKTLEVLNNIIIQANAQTISSQLVEISPDRYIAGVEIKKISKQFIKEFRVCWLGPSSHGKTTTIGYLTYNEKDNGNGSGRMSILKHAHEQSSGLTSSIKHDIFGYVLGKLYNYRSSPNSTWTHIVETSDKIISLFDLPGSSKYSRTMNFGINALKPDLYILVISLAEPLVEEPFNMITQLVQMQTNFIICFTKADKAIHDGSNVIKYVQDLDKKPIQYNNQEDYTVSSNIYYLSISNVIIQAENKLAGLLNLLSENKFVDLVIPSPRSAKPIIGPADFMIYDLININEMGNIISGIVMEGTINIGDKLLIGPISSAHGSVDFVPVRIKTIRKKQIESTHISQGESGSVEIDLANNSDVEITKHMNILSKELVSRVSDIIHVRLNGEISGLLTGESSYILHWDNQVDIGLIVEISESEIKLKSNKLNYIRPGSQISIFTQKYALVQVGSIFMLSRQHQ